MHSKPDDNIHPINRLPVDFADNNDDAIDLQSLCLSWAALEEDRIRILECLDGDGHLYSQHVIDEWMAVLRERDRIFRLRYHQELRDEFSRGLSKLDAILDLLLDPNLKKFAPGLSTSMQTLNTKLQEFCEDHPKLCHRTPDLEEVSNTGDIIPEVRVISVVDEEIQCDGVEVDEEEACPTESTIQDQTEDILPVQVIQSTEESWASSASKPEATSPSPQLSYNSLIGSYMAFDSSSYSPLYAAYPLCPQCQPPLLDSMEEEREDDDKKVGDEVPERVVNDPVPLVSTEETPRSNVSRIPDVVLTTNLSGSVAQAQPKGSRIPVPVAERKRRAFLLLRSTD